MIVGVAAAGIPHNVHGVIVAVVRSVYIAGLIPSTAHAVVGVLLDGVSGDGGSNSRSSSARVVPSAARYAFRAKGQSNGSDSGKWAPASVV